VTRDGHGEPTELAMACVAKGGLSSAEGWWGVDGVRWRWTVRGESVYVDAGRAWWSDAD
jgi:hypothetical protein